MTRRTDRPALPQLPPALALQLDAATRLLIRRALVGLEPGEALSTPAREAVVRLWHTAGLTDLDMAHLSQWSVHVVRRLRDRLELAPNTTHDRRDTA